MNGRLLVYGLAGWLIATAALRLAGQHLLRPGSGIGVVVLLRRVSALIAWLMRRLCHRLNLRPEQWFGAVVSLWLPTLLLDPFSSAFLPRGIP